MGKEIQIRGISLAPPINLLFRHAPMLTNLTMSKNIDMGSWFFNQNFNGVSDDFFDDSLGFDDALKLFDFPLEPVEDNGAVEDWDTEFEGLELPSPDALASLACTRVQGCTEAKNISSPCDETSQLKQLPKSRQVTDCKRSPNQSNSSSTKGSCVFQTSSPVSVLESSISSSGSAVIRHPVPFDSKVIVPVKRRSKRRRSSIPKPKRNRCPVSSSYMEYRAEGILNWGQRKETKRKKLSSLSGEDFPSEAVRKCTHCETTKTPQWREGPKGPKTLCNACGVQYRSGRLFPEYRPISSPTFIAKMHSNSHKKVAELRRKTVDGDMRA